MTIPIITVALETPFAGDVKENIDFARACMKDCLLRGEAPFASHLLYTQVLDDTNSEERKLGMEMGKVIEAGLDKSVVYTDLGISEGMAWGIQKAKEAGRPVEYRTLKK